MDALLQNSQAELAADFQMKEIQVRYNSQIGLLKIQSVKYAQCTPELGARYLQTAKDIMHRSLFFYVSNGFVLSEEGFYFSALEN